MSTPTLPKSFQAQVRNTGGSGDDDIGTSESMSSLDRAQHYKEFLDKFGQLPNDFLRIPSQSHYFDESSVSNSTLPSSTRAIVTRDAPLVDMIDVSVVEAQLVKNYGLLRMDLYCKIRVGHMVCETPTCLNGAKNPKWDGVYQFNLKPGINSFHLEIYDEKQFSLDEKIAWLYEPIPPEVFQGITVERWFPLSGRLGQDKEGSILLVLSHKRMPMRASQFGRSAAVAAALQQQAGSGMTVFVPAGNHPGPAMVGGNSIVPGMDPQIPAYVQPMPPPTTITQNVDPQQQPIPTNANEPGQPVSDEDINQLSEMFPSIDKAVLKAVLENNSNNKEAAISTLLAWES